MKTKLITAAALVCALALTTTIAQAADPLPSWNEGKTKQSILEFVAKVNAFSVGEAFYKDTSAWHVTLGASDQDR